MNEYIKNLKKPVAIVGMGKSGAAALRLLLAAGCAREDIYTFDSKQSDAQFQDHELLLSQVQPNTLVISPGVPLALPWLEQAVRNGLHLTSELSLACSTLADEKIIGVTGSVGKSTTVSILGAGLGAFSKSYFVGGNLGFPLADYAADVLEKKRSRADWIALELSSYQLENCRFLVLDFSVLTYLTSNHLERYQSLDHYYETKWRIEDITRDHVVLNQNGGDIAEFLKRQPRPKKILWADRTQAELDRFRLDQAKLIGLHNQDNLAMASIVALKAGWPEVSIQAMKEFAGLEHRLENLGYLKGIRFINDSKATALDSVQIAVAAACESRLPNSMVFVLLGGRDKNLPWKELNNLGRLPNVDFIFFGECREVAQRKSGLPGASYPSLGQAIDHGLSKVHKSDTLLLSPGGTSWDEFKNFEDRGHYFKSRAQDFATRDS